MSMIDDFKKFALRGNVVDLPVHEIAERLFVDRAVFERRDERCEGTPKARLSGRLGGHDTFSETGRPH